MDAGSRKRIEALYLQMYDMLLAYAWSSFESDTLAEEAVQDTFVIACQKADDVMRSPNPSGWLVNTLKFVIRNTCRSQCTANRIMIQYLSVNPAELASSEDQPSLELLYGNLARSEEFQLLKEMAVDGCSYLEMAEKRGISVQTCRKRLQRAKTHLQKKMKV